MLGAPDRERARQAAEAAPREGEDGAARDRARRESEGCGRRPRAVRGRLWAKYPKAVGSLHRDATELLTFFDFPAEHWAHLRTANIIESPFATVRLRQRVTKGAGSRQKGLLMAFELLAMAERRWRRINAPQLVPRVRAGVSFPDGVGGERLSTRPRAA
jgi:putative transposase